MQVPRLLSVVCVQQQSSRQQTLVHRKTVNVRVWLSCRNRERREWVIGRSKWEMRAAAPSTGSTGKQALARWPGRYVPIQSGKSVTDARSTGCIAMHWTHCGLARSAHPSCCTQPVGRDQLVGSAGRACHFGPFCCNIIGGAQWAGAPACNGCDHFPSGSRTPSHPPAGQRHQRRQKANSRDPDHDKSLLR